MTTQATLAKFFVKAGQLKNYWFRSEGEFPKVVHIACFEYERGFAEYDGSEWSLHLHPALA